MATGAPNPLVGGVGYCEICKTWGHHLTACPLLQKYQSTPRNLFCNFCKSVGHDEKDCHAFDLMRERTLDAYKIQEENVTAEGGIPQYNTPRGFNQGGRGGFGRGRGCGGFGRGGRGPIICYNCNQPGHLARDFPNPCMTCMYCRALDHATKYCPQLIEKWQVRGNQNQHQTQHQNQNQNLQMIVVEEHDDQPRITVVTCGGMRTRPDVTEKGKGVEQWIRKEVEPMPTFNPQKERETYQASKEGDIRTRLDSFYVKDTTSIRHVVGL
jgi:hypothetical protein